jgi:hypothetical protein
VDVRLHTKAVVLKTQGGDREDAAATESEEENGLEGLAEIGANAGCHGDNSFAMEAHVHTLA